MKPAELEAALRHGRALDVRTPAARMASSLIRPAARRGLLDVAVARYDSPLGELTLAATPRGLVRIAFPGPPVADELARRLSPRVLVDPTRLDRVRRELDDYFARRRRRFDLRIDWALTTPFGRRVLEAALRIAPGDVATYGEVAARVGKPRAARAVGNALGSNPIPIVVPCHRVVPAAGGLGGYGGGVERKALLLELEAGATGSR
jgi:methylated-DNA-[protein]-cysteine S-methyltransferase